jgi:hypothetical protein
MIIKRDEFLSIGLNSLTRVVLPCNRTIYGTLNLPQYHLLLISRWLNRRRKKALMRPKRPTWETGAGQYIVVKV